MLKGFDKLLSDLHALFVEVNGRRAKSASETIQWAFDNQIITHDEYGACCINGMVD